MVTITRETSYRCSDDCVVSGCPGHVGTIEYQSTSDAYKFVMNGRELHFERGELEAMLSLLRALNRVDSVQHPTAVDEGVSYPTPRNRQEAAALAGLALAYLGVTRAHIDAVIARCETDLAAQQGDSHD